ncbi:leukotriene B4 receptor 1 isoform X3 [Phyllopteryx taeniolatus]|uniref:leukotriene B4 receptor 1 isoform X3 n=1 Tax=Phyllopteryx taeniolatus TaxID=161469 RepID=UPI002AD4F922|nr:leukotriene B4 receptor 1 isoform X3 [Phyllopteryx taeniolatus]
MNENTVCSSQQQKSDEAMVSNTAAFSLPVSTSAKVGIAILTLAFALGFPGNVFVAWSVVCRVRKRSVTCLLVLNLAAADASVLLTAPVFLRFLAGGRGWEFGSPACKLVHYLSSVNMYVSIYLICLMSMDRWMAVTRPFLSQRMRTKRSLLILLLGVWVSAFLLSIPMPFYRSNLRKVLPNNATLRFCVPYHWQSVGHRVFQYTFETVTGFLVPYSLINTCYSSVICRLQSAAFKRRGQGSRLILMIICTFALFWLPYHIVNTIEVIPSTSQVSRDGAKLNLTPRRPPGDRPFARKPYDRGGRPRGPSQRHRLRLLQQRRQPDSVRLRRQLPHPPGRSRLHGQALRGHQLREQEHIHLHPRRTHRLLAGRRLGSADAFRQTGKAVQREAGRRRRRGDERDG